MHLKSGAQPLRETMRKGRKGGKGKGNRESQACASKRNAAHRGGISLGALPGAPVPGSLTSSGFTAVIIGLAIQDLTGNIIAGSTIHEPQGRARLVHGHNS